MERVFVVFGGGGVKGMAHAGAWRAIQETGLPVAELIGTSIGGLVAACLAGGHGWPKLYELAGALKKPDIVTLNRWALLLNGIRQPSVFQGDTLREYIESVLPVREFSELTIPVSMNAVDLESGRMDWFGAAGRMDVSLVDAIYATCALPLFYPPAELDGLHYVDGGVRDGLPIQLAADRGATLIIAIDVGAGECATQGYGVQGPRRDSSPRDRDHGLCAQTRAAGKLGRPASDLRAPGLDEYSTFDFGRTEFFWKKATTLLARHWLRRGS
jgi:NTE family protein